MTAKENEFLNIHPYFHIDPAIERAADRALSEAQEAFSRIDANTDYNQQKMLAAFLKNRVSESHFAASTGYGYDDRGRETLDRVFADALGAEDALVRHNFVSGTHALTVALFGVLRPGDTMLSVTGTPYDTLQGVIGRGKDGTLIDDAFEPGVCSGSLKEFGIHYREVPLSEDGAPDLPAIEAALRGNPQVRMVYLQRSRGYSLRPSLFVEQIAEIAALAHKLAPSCIVMVDNCYGEFVEREEPVSRGADLMAGSLIKNPGGGVAPTGGYIAGRRDLVEQCAYRLTTPGLGREVGCTLGNNRELFMGAFHAPHVTGEALKTAVFAAGAVRPVRLRRDAALGRAARGHHPDRAAAKRAGARRVLPGDAEGRAGRFVRHPRTVGYARLRQPGHHGGRRVHARRVDRAFRGCPAARAVGRVDAGRVKLPQRPFGRDARRAVDARARPSGKVSAKKACAFCGLLVD